MHFLLSALQIVLIDLLLAGDNALVIALAVRSLPPRERKIGIVGGASAAVILRVGLTFVAAQLLTVPYLQIAGGVLILWIAVRVLMDACAPHDDVPAPQKFWQAVWYIMVADVTMSVDNILAIAGASHGNFWLILFGLAVSIPFIVLSSNLLSRLMDRWPSLVYIGAGILGKVGGEMIMTDPVMVKWWDPSDAVQWVIEGVLALCLIVWGVRLSKRNRKPQRG